MSKYKWSTTSDFITNGKIGGASEGDLIEFEGFTTSGDGGAAQWKATATTGLTPSQTPATRGAAELVDGGGRLWELVSILGMYPVDALGAVEDTDITSILEAAKNSGVVMLTVGSRYYSSNADMSGAEVFCAGESKLFIVPSSTDRNIIKSLSGTLKLTGVTFDASAGSVGNYSVLVSGGGVIAKGCKFTGAQAISGYGDGLQISASALESSFDSCEFSSNGENGLSVQESPRITVINCSAHSNAGIGFNFNNYDVALSKNINNALVQGCKSYSNNTGFTFGNPFDDNDFNGDDFGYDNNVCTNATVTGCAAYGNSNYGFVLSMRGGEVSGLSSYDNTFGGILINGRNISVDSSVVLRNSNFGVDIGHGMDISYTGGVVASNSTVGGEPFLIEASTNVSVNDTYIHSNGSNSASQIVVNALGGTGDGRYFPSITSNVMVSANVELTGNRIGMSINDNPIDVIDRSTYDGDTPENYVRVAAATNNYTIKAVSSRDAIALSSSAGILTVPDVSEEIRLNETATLTGVETASYNYYKERVTYITMVAGGSGYTDGGTTATISGDGTGATLRPIINNGQIVGIRVLTPGSGYTTATVNITGDGAGASANAVIGTGLPRGKRIALMHNQAQTINRNGTRPVKDPSGGNLAAPADGATTLTERYGEWIVTAKNY